MKILVVHIWLLLLLLNQRNGNLASAQCSVPTVLCCPGRNDACFRGCFCDEACLTIGGCCPDYPQTCIQSSAVSSTPVFPPPSSPTSTSPHSPTLGLSSSSSSSVLPVSPSSQTSAPSSSSSSPTSTSSMTSSSANSQPSSPSPPSTSTWTTPHSPTLSSSSSGLPVTPSSQTSAPSSSSQSTTSPTSSASPSANSQPSSPSPPSTSTWTTPHSPTLSSSSSGLPVTPSSQTSAPSSSSQSTTSPTSSASPSVCDTCTENEACQERDGVYGCGCLQGQRPNPEIFDAVESCASSTGSISLSRCQLFESDFHPETLHLNDPSCTGTLENGRLLFYFDNEGHICGTTLMSNSTHFIYQNSIQSNLRNQNIISRDIWMNMTFSCAYPLIQTLSMPMGCLVEGGVLSAELPAGQGTYQIRMIPYHDAQFTSPYDGEVHLQVKQQMYVAVEVEGVDRNQIATVLDTCWATPVNDSEYHIRWNLIIRECPNPDDGTVEVLQNGIDTTSHFSFRMFTFSGISDHIFLHCQVHLCLVQNGRCALLCDPGYRHRRHRSLDFLHSAAISMGLKAQ